MKRKELKAAAVFLAGVLAASGADFSAHATQVATLLPAEGVALALEEGMSVEELEQSASTDIVPKERAVQTMAQPAGGAEGAAVDGGVQSADAGTQDSGSNLTSDADSVDVDTENTDTDDTDTEADDHDAGADDHDAGADDHDAGADDQDTDADDTDTDADDTDADADDQDTDAEDNDTDEEEMPEGYGSLVIARVRDWVNVRSGPSTDTEIVGKLYNNSVGELIRREGDWYYIASGTVTGYVSADYCVSGEEAEALIDEVSIQVATVDAQTLKLRAEGSTQSRVLQLLPYGDKLEVLESDHGDGWVKVNVNGTQGYVSADYVTVSISFVSAESKEEEAARLAEERAQRREAERRAAELAAQEAAQAQAQQPVESSEVVATDQTPAPASTGSGLGADVANYALQFVGNPYVYGGTSLTNGADCSGFVLAVYAQFGVGLPHSASADRSMGTAVGGLAEAQPGDLVCYSGHVGIYIGNGQIVHASTPRTGIKISSATYKPIVCIRRIFN